MIIVLMCEYYVCRIYRIGSRHRKRRRDFRRLQPYDDALHSLGSLSYLKNKKYGLRYERNNYGCEMTSEMCGPRVHDRRARIMNRWKGHTCLSTFNLLCLPPQRSHHDTDHCRFPTVEPQYTSHYTILL